MLKRSEKKEQKSKQHYDKIVQLANSNVKKSKPDPERLEQMYIQYKKQQIANKNLKKKIENEQGITFKPNINVNNNISVNTSFYERNQLQLNKKAFIQNIAKNENNSNKKKVSPEKLDEIVNDIHIRLYRPGLEKQLNRSRIEENKYSKRNRENSSLRNTDKFVMMNNYNNYKNNIRNENRFPNTTNDAETNVEHNYYKIDPDIRNIEEDETIKDTYKNVEDSNQGRYQFVEDLDI